MIGIETALATMEAIRDLGLGEEPHVGPALGHRHRVAAQIDAPHAGALGELRAERIVDAAGEQVRLGDQELAERAPHVLHDPPPQAAWVCATEVAHQRQ